MTSILCITLMCIWTCIFAQCVCPFMHVEVGGWPRVSSSFLSTLYNDTKSLTKPRTHGFSYSTYLDCSRDFSFILQEHWDYKRKTAPPHLCGCWDVTVVFMLALQVPCPQSCVPSSGFTSWSHEAWNLRFFRLSLPIASQHLGLGLSSHIADGKLKCTGKWVTHSQTVTQPQRDSGRAGPSAVPLTGVIPRLAWHPELCFPGWTGRQPPPSRRPALQHLRSTTAEVLRQEVREQRVHFSICIWKGHVDPASQPLTEGKDPEACL